MQLAGAARAQPAQPLQRVQEHASVAQTGPEEHLHSALPGRCPSGGRTRKCEQGGKENRDVLVSLCVLFLFHFAGRQGCVGRGSLLLPVLLPPLHHGRGRRLHVLHEALPPRHRAVTQEVHRPNGRLLAHPPLQIVHFIYFGSLFD